MCEANTTEGDWDAAPDVPVRIKATRADGTVTVEGVIRLWVTSKPGPLNGRLWPRTRLRHLS